MEFPERGFIQEEDAALISILEQYGEVPVLDHNGQPQPLSQAVDECPPLVTALLGAESPEQLEQIINALKAP